MNFSIHYTLEKEFGFYTLMDEINKRAEKGHTKLMISFIDSNVFFRDNNYIHFDDGGFFKKLETITYNFYDTISYYFPWRSNTVKQEKMFNYHDLKRKLFKSGWNEYQSFTSELKIQENGYKELNQAIKRITFIKN